MPVPHTPPGGRGSPHPNPQGKQLRGREPGTGSGQCGAERPGLSEHWLSHGAGGAACFWVLKWAVWWGLWRGHSRLTHGFTIETCTHPFPPLQREKSGVLQSCPSCQPSLLLLAAGEPTRVLWQRGQDRQVLAGRHGGVCAHIHGPQTQRERPQVPRGHL